MLLSLFQSLCVAYLHPSAMLQPTVPWVTRARARALPLLFLAVRQLRFQGVAAYHLIREGYTLSQLKEGGYPIAGDDHDYGSQLASALLLVAPALAKCVAATMKTFQAENVDAVGVATDRNDPEYVSVVRKHWCGGPEEPNWQQWDSGQNQIRRPN
jgi:hypothetical protein